jgi:5-methylthioadenosine/S-adenosylhomocysteine deaminase
MNVFRGLVDHEKASGNIVEEIYFPLEEALTHEDVRAFARMGAWECLLAGQGTVFDHYYHAEAVAEALLEVGLCGVVAPTVQDLSGPARTQMDRILEVTLDLHGRESLREAGVRIALGPHATDTVSAKAWTRLARIATDHQLPIHAHVAQSLEEIERTASDGGPVGRLSPVLEAAVPLLAVHGLYLTTQDVQRLAGHNTWLGYCPSAQDLFGFPAHVPGWWAAGVPVVVGADTGSCNDGMDVQSEVRRVASAAAAGVTHGVLGETWRADGELDSARSLDRSRRQHLSAAEALKTVWGTPADWAKPLLVGRIEPGYRANLIAVSMDHPAMWPCEDPARALAFGQVAQALEAVVVNGVWRSIEEIRASEQLAAHQEEARSRRAAWLKRAGHS